jgi:hypothetical protein
MKATFRLLFLGLTVLAVGGVPATHAGHFKRITIDGAFTDWAGVPPTFVDAEDATESAAAAAHQRSR